jgi:hypothetical protein
MGGSRFLTALGLLRLAEELVPLPAMVAIRKENV